MSGLFGAQGTFYVGNMKGVGRIYQQTFIDTYAKVAFAKLYDRKTPITAADLLNDRVVPLAVSDQTLAGPLHVVGLDHEQPVPIFQQLAGGHPPGL